MLPSSQTQERNPAISGHGTSLKNDAIPVSTAPPSIQCFPFVGSKKCLIASLVLPFMIIPHTLYHALDVFSQTKLTGDVGPIVDGAP